VKRTKKDAARLPNLRIGLTGGLGTGKSTVAAFFRELGAKVIDADRLAHRCLRKDHSASRRVIREFGSGILDREGRIDRRRLAKEVFGHPKRLERLTRIVHPPVRREIRNWLRRGGGVRIAVVPLLFEAGIETWFDKVIVVKASKSTVFTRLRADREMSAEEIELRRLSQLPLREKIARADLTIDNNGSLESTREQASRIWSKLGEGQSAAVIRLPRPSRPLTGALTLKER